MVENASRFSTLRKAGVLVGRLFLSAASLNQLRGSTQTKRELTIEVTAQDHPFRHAPVAVNGQRSEDEGKGHASQRYQCAFAVETERGNVKNTAGDDGGGVDFAA
jgi:hypothetical protein